MIFDVHTHLAFPESVYGDFQRDGERVWGKGYSAICTPEMHREAIKNCSGAVVLALDAPFAGYTTSNELLAEYVRSAPGVLFGFAGVDPNREGSARLLEYAIKELALCGLKLGPIYQNFDPYGRAARELYAKAQELKIPIMWHMATSFVRFGPLEWSHPMLIDRIARDFPDLKMIIAHLGHPWYAETACVVRKHPNVYADISALGCRQWQFYNAMLCAVEYGIAEKLFFGTDLPTFSVDDTESALMKINQFTRGTALPEIPIKTIENIINRNTPEILGLK
jgi:predicted TIM-barrel fold metal-dependent hydrolase